MPHHPAITRASAAIGAATRHDRNNPRLPDLRRDLAAEKLAVYVATIVAKAPPLTPAQRDRIAALLTPAVDVEADAS